MEPWIQTAHDHKFDLLEPTVDMVDIRDIAHALSHQCRYTGHTKKFFSVAQHCLLVADYLREAGHTAYVQLCGLLHDASEAYLSDLASPWKQATPLGPIYAKYEGVIMDAVADRFDLERGFDKRSEVKTGDRYSLLLEAKYLMHEPAWAADGTEMGAGFYPLPEHLWSNANHRPETICGRFLQRYRVLCAERVDDLVAAVA